MKAVVFTRYGSPDVLRLTEIEKPVPNDNEVLIRMQAASANAADWHLMRGAPFLARLEFGLTRPKHTILGADIAGVVEAVGRGVTQFKPGDEVFGDLSAREFGAYAEYVAAPESAVAPKPANLSFEEAAAVPLAAVTALQGLRDKGQIQAGQKVLINGASGGVGTFAVQIARAFGAEVTGVCSTAKLDTTRAIGADHVIDYTQQDFTRSGQQYDLIFDVAASHSASAYRRALRPGGRCVVAGFSTLGHMLGQIVFLGGLMSLAGSRKIGSMGTARPNQQDLFVLKDLLESGQIAPVIDRRYPLSETADAIRYLEEGHARGKIVIVVAQTHPA